MNLEGKAINSMSSRSTRGNTLVLLVGITAILVIAVIFFGFDYMRMAGTSHQHHSAVESASLTAAADLARIVINDPNYGYIALSDYPPIGTATVAPDGEPLPVTGINTILGTARLDLIVATELNQPDLRTLAMNDVQKAKQAARNLEAVLVASLVPGGTAQARDMDGNPVRPFDDARNVYLQNVQASGQGAPVLNAFELKLGYLTSAGTTMTPVPQPDSLSQVPAGSQQNGFYKAFINIPAGGEDFYFAGMSQQPSLVDGRQFVQPDGVHLCSIVQVHAKHTFNKTSTAGSSNGQQATPTVVDSFACAQPAGRLDTPPPGVMTISFPDGFVPGINSINDLFANSQLRSNPSTVASPTGGDFPADPGSSLVPTTITAGGGSPTVTQVFAQGFYNWLRNGRTRPRIDSLKDIVNEPFDQMNLNGTQTVHKWDLMQKAYAGNGTNSPTQTGIVRSTNGSQRVANLLSGNAQGRAAYDAIARYEPVRAQLPPNVLAIDISATGVTTTAGGNTALPSNNIAGFWGAVQDTNTAAVATMAIAQQAIDAANAQIAGASAVPPTNTVPLSTAQGDLAMATQALNNARDAANVTQQMTRDQLALTSLGLSANPDGTYTLAGRTFTPHPLPAADANSILTANAPSGAPSNMDWTAASGFSTYRMPSNLSAIESEPPVAEDAFVMMMHEFDAQGRVARTCQEESPFVDQAVSERQYIAISTNAYTTTGPTPVTWTMVSRDQVNKLGPQNGGKHAGQAMAGNPVNWCELGFYNGSPAIAASKAKGSQALGLTLASAGDPYANVATRGSMWWLADALAQPAFARPTGGGFSVRGGANNGGYSVRGSQGSNSRRRNGGPSGNAYGWRRRNQAGYQLNTTNPLLAGARSLTTAVFRPAAGGNLSVQPRKNYYCGGMSLDFQLRSPLVVSSNLTATRTNNLVVTSGSGQATATVNGTTYNVPNASNFVVQPGTTSAAGTVADPTTSTTRDQTADAPANLL